MLGLVSRVLVRLPLRAAVGGLGAAVLAGVGWKLGADLYEGLKRRVKRSPAPPRDPR